MVWHFIGVYIINRTLHGRLEKWNFSSCVEKNISPIRCAHSWNIFQHSKRNFVSPCGHEISSITELPSGSFSKWVLQGSYPFWTKTSRTFQGLLRTHFPFFKDSIQCKKEPWVYVFFSSTTTWAILSWRSFILGTWESGLDRVSTEIQGLPGTDCNFQGLSRPWTFSFKFQGLSRTFKMRANPGSSLLSIILK